MSTVIAVPSPIAPVVPKGVPAWLIKLVALVVAFAGPALIWVDPTGKISTPAAQALIVLGFLIVAAAIFTVHLILAAVHEYGWSKAALNQVDTAGLAELKAMWPELRATYQAAKPALDLIPGVPAALATAQADLEQLKSTVAAIPAGQRQAALDVLSTLGQAAPGAPAPPAA